MMMEKNIKILRVIYVLTWCLVAAFAILNECNCLPKGYLVGNERAIYRLHSFCILWTMAVIYLSWKLFSLRGIVRRLAEADTPRRQSFYGLLSALRIEVLGLSALAGLAVYYATLDLTGGLCALMVLLTLFMCWPRSASFPADHNDDHV